MFVNAIMYYKVANATHAVSNVDDYSGSARLLAATTLRNVLGTMTLGDILCNREAIAKEMKVCSLQFPPVPGQIIITLPLYNIHFTLDRIG